MTGPRETVSFVSPRPVMKCFVIPPDSKLEKKTAEKSFALLRLAHKFAAVSRSTS